MVHLLLYADRFDLERLISSPYGGGRRVWLLLERREVSVCATPPRFDADVVVRADLAFFYRLWLGHIEYDAAIRCGSLVVEGIPALTKQLPRWLMWSPMARFVRDRASSARISTS